MKNKIKKNDAVEKGFYSEENTLLLYLKEINRIPLLSKAEEEKMAIYAAQGNAAARDRLVNANLRFVVAIAKKYQGKGLPLEDLISEGNLGLLNAVKYFDAEKGFRFITYAVWWIRQAITKAIHEKARMIRLPCNKVNELTKIDKTREIIRNEQGRKKEHEVQEIALMLEMQPKKAEELIRISQDVLSLDDDTGKIFSFKKVNDMMEDDSSATPVDNAINTMLKDELEEAINSLEKRDADIIRLRYGLGDTAPLTLKEIGANFNLSRERIRQIEKRALTQLQQSAKKNLLMSYIA